VAAGHLVADGDLPLLGDVHLHQLDDARRQLVRLENLVDLIFRLLLDLGALRAGRVEHRPHLFVHRLVRDAQRLEVDVDEVDLTELLPAELGPGRQKLLDRPRLQHQADFLIRE